MNITGRRSRIKTLRQSDPDFMLKDGLMISPRAGFQISSGCPQNYREIIAECINHGWLKPVAHLMDYEYTMDKLKESYEVD